MLLIFVILMKWKLLCIDVLRNIEHSLWSMKCDAFCFADCHQTRSTLCGMESSRCWLNGKSGLAAWIWLQTWSWHWLILYGGWAHSTRSSSPGHVISQRRWFNSPMHGTSFISMLKNQQYVYIVLLFQNKSQDLWWTAFKMLCMYFSNLMYAELGSSYEYCLKIN